MLPWLLLFKFCLLQRNNVNWYDVSFLSLMFCHFLIVVFYFCCVGILLLLVHGVLVLLGSACSIVLVPLRHQQPPVWLLLRFSCWIFVCMKLCTMLLFQVSCIFLYGFSCPGVQRMSYPPTILVCWLAQLSVWAFWCFLSITFVNFANAVCMSCMVHIVVLPLGDEIIAPVPHLVSYILGQC